LQTHQQQKTNKQQELCEFCFFNIADMKINIEYDTDKVYNLFLCNSCKEQIDPDQMLDHDFSIEFLR
jgi:hypothetical protein